MGYDASVYLIYGVRVKYDADTPKDELLSILKVIVPDLLEEYGEEDVFSCFDEDPHAGGYYCLNYDDQLEKQSELIFFTKSIRFCVCFHTQKLFIACYFHRHTTARRVDGSLEVDLPSNRKRKEFKEWLIENGIKEKPKFYTKLYESY